MDDNNLSFFLLSILTKSGQRFAHNTRVSDYYKGSFTSDVLEGNRDLKISFLGAGRKPTFICFIVNTLHSQNAGPHEVGHWLGVAILYTPANNTAILRFFDSFASNYKKYSLLARYIGNLKSQCLRQNVKFIFDRLSKPIQSIDSKLCGPYVCYALAKIWETKNQQSLGKIFSTFLKRSGYAQRRKNDGRIEKYVEQNWKTGFCHNQKTNNAIKVLPIQKLLSIHPPPSFCPKATLGISKCRVGKCLCNI